MITKDLSKIKDSAIFILFIRIILSTFIFIFVILAIVFAGLAGLFDGLTDVFEKVSKDLCGIAKIKY